MYFICVNYISTTERKQFDKLSKGFLYRLSSYNIQIFWIRVKKGKTSNFYKVLEYLYKVYS